MLLEGNAPIAIDTQSHWIMLYQGIAAGKQLQRILSQHACAAMDLRDQRNGRFGIVSNRFIQLMARLRSGNGYLKIKKTSLTLTPFDRYCSAQLRRNF